MGHDWLLIETLGQEHAVVCQGDRLRKFVPTDVFLRRNPHRRQIEQAISTAARTGESSVERASHSATLIHTEPVVMTDGHVHGVHVWTGPPVNPVPDRPAIGAFVWNVTTGLATDTLQALLNSGADPNDPLDGRLFADDLAISEFHPEEHSVIAATISSEPSQTFCATWDVTARDGDLIRVSFASRVVRELQHNGHEHTLIRAMNWRSPREDSSTGADADLAQRIVRGMTQEGVYRVLANIDSWRLLKWLDPPCPYFDWRGGEPRELVHPADAPRLRAMAQQFVTGPAQGTLRLRGTSGWTPLHITVHRVELNPDVFAALISIRLPADQA